MSISALIAGLEAHVEQGRAWYKQSQKDYDAALKAYNQDQEMAEKLPDDKRYGLVEEPEPPNFPLMYFPLYLMANLREDMPLGETLLCVLSYIKDVNPDNDDDNYGDEEDYAKPLNYFSNLTQSKAISMFLQFAALKCPEQIAGIIDVISNMELLKETREGAEDDVGMDLLRLKMHGVDLTDLFDKREERIKNYFADIKVLCLEKSLDFLISRSPVDTIRELKKPSKDKNQVALEYRVSKMHELLMTLPEMDLAVVEASKDKGRSDDFKFVLPNMHSIEQFLGGLTAYEKKALAGIYGRITLHLHLTLVRSGKGVAIEIEKDWDYSDSIPAKVITKIKSKVSRIIKDKYPIKAKQVMSFKELHYMNDSELEDKLTDVLEKILLSKKPVQESATLTVSEATTATVSAPEVPPTETPVSVGATPGDVNGGTEVAANTTQEVK